jgi:hypothetical protein
MPPIADFICLSKKCATPEGAPAYELPVNAVCCPACGSRRIKRLFNRVNVITGAQPDHFNGKLTSSSHAARTDAFAGPAMDQAIAKRDEVREKARLYPMVNAVPMRNLGANLQQVYMGNGAAAVPAIDHSAVTKKATLGGTLPSVMGELPSRIPVSVEKTDREYRLVKGKDGPEISKA